MENLNLNAESSATQCARIKAHLESGKALTGLDALKLFGCMCLPRRIKDLKERGVDIRDKWIVTESGKRVKRYFIA